MKENKPLEPRELVSKEVYNRIDTILYIMHGTIHRYNLDFPQRKSINYYEDIEINYRKHPAIHSDRNEEGGARLTVRFFDREYSLCGALTFNLAGEINETEIAERVRIEWENIQDYRTSYRKRRE